MQFTHKQRSLQAFIEVNRHNSIHLNGFSGHSTTTSKHPQSARKAKNKL